MNTSQSIQSYIHKSTEKIKRWYRALPDKKRYLEFITALLTIPVLLTVLLNNVSSFQKQNVQTPTPVITQAIMSTATPLPLKETISTTQTVTPTQTVECIKEVGPMEILYPTEQDAVSGNPICIEISKQRPNYCSVVWSYRINGGGWSNYTDRTICMYGLSPGVKNMELRIKSIVSGDELILKRSFTVPGEASPTPATTSSQLQ